MVYLKLYILSSYMWYDKCIQHGAVSKAAMLAQKSVNLNFWFGEIIEEIILKKESVFSR